MKTTGNIQIDTIVYWVRSTGPAGLDRVPMYYKGRWARDCDDGQMGDVRCRPVSLGTGPFTCTVAPDDVESKRGDKLF